MTLYVRKSFLGVWGDRFCLTQFLEHPDPVALGCVSAGGSGLLLFACLFCFLWADMVVAFCNFLPVAISQVLGV